MTCELESEILFCKVEYPLSIFIVLIIFLLCWAQHNMLGETIKHA